MGRSASVGEIPGFEQFLKRLKRKVSPSRVLLFGSRASGEHLLTSDVDLLIVSEAFDGMPWRNRVQLVLSLWEGDLTLEPLCYTESEFRTRSKQASIVREAARTGVTVPI